MSIFGQREPGASYVRRPSAYAVVENGLGQVVLVRTIQGVFLPGGGIEEDETPEQAVLREVREECGLVVRLLSRLPDAVQLVYSHRERIHFEKVSAFFLAAVAEGHPPSAPEKGHEVRWVPLDDAKPLLSHESHRFALAAAEAGRT